MEFREVVEGGVRLKVPVVAKLSRRNSVFYNPVMDVNRDISVAVAKILKPESFCDALAGSGARGLRVAAEAGVPEVVLNDLNNVACDLMRENARLNGLDVEVVNDDLNRLLSGRKFDFVDVDPFGPPVRYLDSAVRAMGKRGWLGVAATDTSALCGSAPRAGRRKYDAASLRTDYYNELGLRILLSFIARTAVRYDRGIRVLFSHCTRHYFRAFVELYRGRSLVRGTQDSVVFLQHCFKCLWRGYRRLSELSSSCGCGAPLSTAGPLWGAEFADAGFCGKLAREIADLGFEKSGEEAGLVSMVAVEQDTPVPYYNFHKLCSVLGRDAPRRDIFFERLVSDGFRVCRTHFNRLGVRTDAPLEYITETLRVL